ncbi:hypothetical protein Tco_0431508 [Tanacetum coccineum]
MILPEPEGRVTQGLSTSYVDVLSFIKRVLRIILVILPEHPSDTKVFTVKMEILLEPTSNKLMRKASTSFSTPLFSCCFPQHSPQPSLSLSNCLSLDLSRSIHVCVNSGSYKTDTAGSRTDTTWSRKDTSVSRTYSSSLGTDTDIILSLEGIPLSRRDEGVSQTDTSESQTNTAVSRTVIVGSQRDIAGSRTDKSGSRSDKVGPRNGTSGSRTDTTGSQIDTTRSWPDTSGSLDGIEAVRLQTDIARFEGVTDWYQSQGYREPVVMSSVTSAVTYTSVYTDSEPGRAFWGADDEEAHDPDYVPEPIYPEYIPLEDDHEFLAEEQPFPPIDSPTAESPERVTESDPEEDPEEYEDDETEDGMRYSSNTRLSVRGMIQKHTWHYEIVGSSNKRVRWYKVPEIISWHVK